MQYLSENKLGRLSSIISDCRKAVIVVHTHPDGDALGSGIGMKRYLCSKGKDVTLIVPDNMPATLDFLTRGEGVVDASSDPVRAGEAIAECDTLLVQDMNSFGRAEALAPMLKSCGARHKVLIDHHLDPDSESFDLVFSENKISSASEYVFWILRALEGAAEALPEKALYALMTGMTTDTNNFSNSVYPSTLQMAGELLSAGVDRDDILTHLYQEYSETRIRAFAALLGEHLTLLPGGVAYVVADKEFQAEYPMDQGETEGLVNIPLGIGAVKMSIFLKEHEGHFRVSIRSKKGWSANRLARQYFNGGGHEQAAGGKLFFPQDIAEPSAVYDYLSSTVAQFLQIDSKQ